MKRLLALLILTPLLAHAVVKSPPSGSGGGGSGGTVTNVATGTGLTGGPISTSGTVALANLPANTYLCNPTGSTAAPQNCTPNQMVVSINALVSAASAVTLTTGTPAFGAYTNDGTSLTAGTLVMVYGQAAGQTCGTGTISNGTGGAITGSGFCSGLWRVQSGAWTRDPQFPSGWAIPSGCNLSVFIQRGTAFTGHTFSIGNSVTVDSAAIPVTDRTLRTATTTVAGLVTVTDATGVGVVSWTGSLPTVAGACAFTGDDSAGLIFAGNAFVQDGGACLAADANGHIASAPNSQSAPAVTGTGCSLSAGGQDNSGAIVATGVDTCTLTFGSSFTVAPACSIGNVGATVLANLNSLPTTTEAIFGTAAAGTFTYTCF